MGIHGLASWIHWAARSTVTAPDWKTFEGKTIGIDILGFLYKWKHGKQSAFLHLAHMIAAFRRARIRPVFVFDGRPPAAKTTNHARPVAASPQSGAVRAFCLPSARSAGCASPLAISSAERDQVKQFLYACGVLSLNAAEEADDVLAAFARSGDFAAVISHDFDMLARGVETLLVPKPYALPGDSDGWSTYTLSAIERAASLTHSQFVIMCVLMGCDYTEGLPDLPYCRAYWMAKREGNGALTEAVQQAAVLRLMGMTGVPIMGEKQWEKWYAGEPSPEPETLSAWRGDLAVLEAQVFEALTHDLHRSPGDGQCRSGQLDSGVEGRVCAQDHPEGSEGEHEQNQKENGG